ncbi:MAG: Ldh family oxidoreductase [Kiritimatiellae bacterium]|nr:Ldh family oxidoreductase [Kiritimatiellia bacterium]
MPRYPVDNVRSYCEACLAREGLVPADAALLTDVLLEADLRGKGSHGLLRLGHYIERLRNGTIKTRPDLRFKAVAPAAAIMDADDGLGHLASIRAMEHAVDLSKDTGIAAVSVINSSHFGFAGYYTELAAARETLGLAFTHTDANTVPFGSNEPYFGSNALSFSAPTGLDYPMTIDFCCAKISFGKVYEAKAKGIQLPEHCALDAKGQWTRDPAQVEYLCTAAEHKGFGLALIIEVLCALLTGIPFGKYVADMYGQMDRPRKLGHFFVAVDIARFSDLSRFRENMRKMIGDLHALAHTEDVEHVRVHGEQSHRNKQESLRLGVLLQPAVAEDLQGLGRPFGLAFPSAVESSP